MEQHDAARKLDRRSRYRYWALHPLPDALFTALFALLCDCAAYTEMALFAEDQLDWLRRDVELSRTQLQNKRKRLTNPHRIWRARSRVCAIVGDAKD